MKNLKDGLIPENILYIGISFHHRVVSRIEGKTDRRTVYGEWEWTPLADVL